MPDDSDDNYTGRYYAPSLNTDDDDDTDSNDVSDDSDSDNE